MPLKAMVNQSRVTTLKDNEIQFEDDELCGRKRLPFTEGLPLESHNQTAKPSKGFDQLLPVWNQANVEQSNASGRQSELSTDPGQPNPEVSDTSGLPDHPLAPLEPMPRHLMPLLPLREVTTKPRTQLPRSLMNELSDQILNEKKIVVVWDWE